MGPGGRTLSSTLYPGHDTCLIDAPDFYALMRFCAESLSLERALKIRLDLLAVGKLALRLLGMSETDIKVSDLKDSQVRTTRMRSCLPSCSQP